MYPELINKTRIPQIDQYLDNKEEEEQKQEEQPEYEVPQSLTFNHNFRQLILQKVYSYLICHLIDEN